MRYTSWIATAVFVVPTLLLGLLVYYRPELILSVVDPATAAEFDQHVLALDRIDRPHALGAHRLGHVRFLHPQQYRRCVPVLRRRPVFAGVGSLFYLAYNGVLIGAIAGYLTERGYGSTFYSFVVTHAAFELTAIVLSGAAGLRIGHSLLAPGRSSRMQSLVAAARDSIVIVYGVAVMLLIAAAVEAFWSSPSGFRTR